MSDGGTSLIQYFQNSLISSINMVSESTSVNSIAQSGGMNVATQSGGVNFGA